MTATRRKPLVNALVALAAIALVVLGALGFLGGGARGADLDFGCSADLSSTPPAPPAPGAPTLVGGSVVFAGTVPATFPLPAFVTDRTVVPDGIKFRVPVTMNGLSGFVNFLGDAAPEVSLELTLGASTSDDPLFRVAGLVELMNQNFGVPKDVNGQHISGGRVDATMFPSQALRDALGTAGAFIKVEFGIELQYALQGGGQKRQAITVSIDSNGTGYALPGRATISYFYKEGIEAGSTERTNYLGIAENFVYTGGGPAVVQPGVGVGADVVDRTLEGGVWVDHPSTQVRQAYDHAPTSFAIGSRSTCAPWNPQFASTTQIGWNRGTMADAANNAMSVKVRSGIGAGIGGGDETVVDGAVHGIPDNLDVVAHPNRIDLVHGDAPPAGQQRPTDATIFPTIDLNEVRFASDDPATDDDQPTFVTGRAESLSPHIRVVQRTAPNTTEPMTGMAIKSCPTLSGTPTGSTVAFHEEGKAIFNGETEATAPARRPGCVAHPVPGWTRFVMDDFVPGAPETSEIPTPPVETGQPWLVFARQAERSNAAGPLAPARSRIAANVTGLAVLDYDAGIATAPDSGIDAYVQSGGGAKPQFIVHLDDRDRPDDEDQNTGTSIDARASSDGNLPKDLALRYISTADDPVRVEYSADDSMTLTGNANVLLAGKDKTTGLPKPATRLFAAYDIAASSDSPPAGPPSEMHVTVHQKKADNGQENGSVSYDGNKPARFTFGATISDRDDRLVNERTRLHARAELPSELFAHWQMGSDGKLDHVEALTCGVPILPTEAPPATPPQQPNPDLCPITNPPNSVDVSIVHTERPALFEYPPLLESPIIPHGDVMPWAGAKHPEFTEWKDEGLTAVMRSGQGDPWGARVSVRNVHRAWYLAEPNTVCLSTRPSGKPFGLNLYKDIVGKRGYSEGKSLYVNGQITELPGIVFGRISDNPDANDPLLWASTKECSLGKPGDVKPTDPKGGGTIDPRTGGQIETKPATTTTTTTTTKPRVDSRATTVAPATTAKLTDLLGIDTKATEAGAAVPVDPCKDNPKCPPPPVDPCKDNPKCPPPVPPKDPTSLIDVVIRYGDPSPLIDQAKIGIYPQNFPVRPQTTTGADVLAGIFNDAWGLHTHAVLPIPDTLMVWEPLSACPEKTNAGRLRSCQDGAHFEVNDVSDSRFRYASNLQWLAKTITGTFKYRTAEKSFDILADVEDIPGSMDATVKLSRNRRLPWTDVDVNLDATQSIKKIEAKVFDNNKRAYRGDQFNMDLPQNTMPNYHVALRSLPKKLTVQGKLRFTETPDSRPEKPADGPLCPERETVNARYDGYDQNGNPIMHRFPEYAGRPGVVISENDDGYRTTTPELGYVDVDVTMSSAVASNRLVIDGFSGRESVADLVRGATDDAPGTGITLRADSPIPAAIAKLRINNIGLFHRDETITYDDNLCIDLDIPITLALTNLDDVRVAFAGPEVVIDRGRNNFVGGNIGEAFFCARECDNDAPNTTVIRNGAPYWEHVVEVDPIDLWDWEFSEEGDKWKDMGIIPTPLRCDYDHALGDNGPFPCYHTANDNIIDFEALKMPDAEMPDKDRSPNYDSAEFVVDPLWGKQNRDKLYERDESWSPGRPGGIMYKMLATLSETPILFPQAPDLLHFNGTIPSGRYSETTDCTDSTSVGDGDLTRVGIQDQPAGDLTPDFNIHSLVLVNTCTWSPVGNTTTVVSQPFVVTKHYNGTIRWARPFGPPGVKLLSGNYLNASTVGTWKWRIDVTPELDGSALYVVKRLSGSNGSQQDYSIARLDASGNGYIINNGVSLVPNILSAVAGTPLTIAAPSVPSNGYTRVWNFGDGRTATYTGSDRAINRSATYDLGGTYFVNIMDYDADGKEAKQWTYRVQVTGP